MASPAAPTDAIHVLVVTDDSAVRTELQWAFAQRVEISFATEARDAFRGMTDSVPDAVVVDLRTGSSGGFSLTHDMKATARLNGVPVVILIEREQDRWLARRAGGDEVLVKPIAAEVVVAAVERLRSA